MRGLKANQRVFWYANYVSTVDDYDTDGNIVGRRPTFSNPVKCCGNVSSARGVSSADKFGVFVEYDKKISPLPTNLQINETTVFWVDTMPTIGAGGTTTTPYDYTVIRIEDSLTHKGVELRRVNVT